MRWREFKHLLEEEEWLGCGFVGLIVVPVLVALVSIVIAFMKWLLT